ncbi:MAG: nucleotidyl transferase AbiEii/AbiGii toxin family protein [Treponema sp.]|nr:nucleotidyl transferase AbiEii/AbiGii toxin family protein [Treponema sp.]
MEKRQLPEDFKDFIRCLNSNKVKYLLVGGWAVGLYGHPRATRDIDFFIFINDNNLKNIEKAFIEFGAPPINIEYLRIKGNVVRFGNSPVKIDIINKADGIDIKDCYPRRMMITVEDLEIPVISKADLIINKKSTGRQSDFGDVEKLESSN